MTEEKALAEGVVFDFKSSKKYKSLAGIRRSIKAMEKDGGFHPNQCAYYFEENDWRGNPAFSVVFAIQQT